MNGPSEMAPTVSIGMPVYNGVDTLPRALDSLLGQTFTDFEITVSDNASSDGTAELCRAYASRDPRVRYFRNSRNIGQIANFNRAFELSRGRYFRWAGCNDWWEPDYLEHCVLALDEAPSAIMATCDHEYHGDDGVTICEEHHGERVTAAEPHRRFSRMLWFLLASRYIFDPIYSLIRLEALRETALLRPILGTDFALAAQLSLVGPVCHVPRRLVHRTISADASYDELIQRFDPAQRSATGWVEKLACTMAEIVSERDMTMGQKAYCYVCIARFYALRRAKDALVFTRRTVALRSRVRRWAGGANGSKY